MKSKPLEISFSPADNQRLANLCGTLDENLKQVETALDVIISRRGEHFSLSGKLPQTQMAAQALQHFYDHSQHHLSLEQIQLGLIEVLNRQHYPVDVKSITTEAEDARQLPGPPQLMTRRSNLYGRTPRQSQYLQQIQEHDITFAVGPAGTGKTYLAVASAVDALERGLVSRLILVRPAVEAGERLGFLPGDMTQKVDPYLRPLYDALYDLMGFDKTSKQFERNTIEIAPLAFMRGRTLNNTFIILDEGQNTTVTQMKMFLTRMGQHSKIVVTGDITQTDLPEHVPSGLVDAVERLQHVPGVGVIRLSGEDIVRHPLVRRIVAAYDADRPQSRVENQESGARAQQAVQSDAGSGSSSLDS